MVDWTNYGRILLDLVALDLVRCTQKIVRARVPCP
jgi:hypothetical protein